MKFNEIVTEIRACDGTGELQLPEIHIINNSSIAGDVEGRDVLLFTHQNQKLYFMMENNKISAFVLLVDQDIRGIKNVSSTAGQVTAIIAFLIRTLRMKLRIRKDEELSPDGFRWLKALILSGGRGFTITDNTGQLPDIAALEVERANSYLDRNAGNIEIFIESVNRSPLKPKSSYCLLMNPHDYLYCRDIL
jgi:hypothetical protein